MAREHLVVVGWGGWGWNREKLRDIHKENVMLLWDVVDLLKFEFA